MRGRLFGSGCPPLEAYRAFLLTFCESFNGRLRDECLNVYESESIEHVRGKLESRRVDYNESRPHGALGNLIPSDFA
jgi:putative transposase